MSEEKQLAYFQQRLRAGQFSRREFLGRATALGLATPLAMSMASSAMAEGDPVKGGVLRVGLGGGSTGDSLDPATFTNTFHQSFGFALRNFLAEINNDDELVPELAESWEVSEDAKTWTIKLRSGIQFHSGKEFDADDAIASLLYHTSEDSKSPAKALLSSIVNISKNDSHSITIELDAGNVGFPALLSDYHVPMMPVKDGTLDVLSGDGTGGYILKNFEPGVRIEMTRNPNYWKEGRAHFDEVVMISINDVVARTNALVTGEVDVADRPDLKTLHLLERNADVNILEVPSSQYYSYPMIGTSDPWSNTDASLAVKYAIDRQAMVDTILFGHGTVGNDHPIGSSYQFHDPNLEQTTQDLDKAAFHAKKAGLDGTTVQLHSSDAAFAGAVDGAVLIAENCQRAGIDVEVVRVPADGYWNPVTAGQFPWYATYWNPRPTADMMFTIAFAKEAPWNDTRTATDRFTELLTNARVELDEDKRREIYYEMQKITREENSNLIPMFANFVYVANKSIAHGRLASAWDLDGTRFIERWWFA